MHVAAVQGHILAADLLSKFECAESDAPTEERHKCEESVNFNAISASVDNHAEEEMKKSKYLPRSYRIKTGRIPLYSVFVIGDTMICAKKRAWYSRIVIEHRISICDGLIRKNSNAITQS